MTVVIGFTWPCTHDNGVAAIVDGKLVFATEEERYTKHKHSTFEPAFNSFIELFKYLHKNFNIRPEEIDAFATHYDTELITKQDLPEYTSKSLEGLRKTPAGEEEIQAMLSKQEGNVLVNLARLFLTTVYKHINATFPKDAKIYTIEHHLAHAASAYYFSGYSSSAIIVADSSSELNATSIWAAKKDSFEKVLAMPTAVGSLGKLYDYMGRRINLGGPMVAAGKLMGLAPYGEMNNKIYDRLLKGVCPDSEKKSVPYYFNSKIFRENPSRAKVRATYQKFVSGVTEGFNVNWDPKGKLDKNITDVAWCTQNLLERSLLSTARWARENINSSNLCFAGGVGLNAKANMEIYYKRIFDDHFFMPAANDEGAVIGAAAYVYRNILGKKLAKRRLDNVYLGPEYDDYEIKNLVKKGKWNAEYIGDDVSEISSLIHKNKIVAWYQGRAEFGPRALGNRSIIGNPLKKDNWSAVNEVKKREWWRPLCPSIIQEDLNRYFINPIPHEFMILMLKLKPFGVETAPAIAHVDNTARLQSVERSTNKTWYDLIKGFKQLSGEGIIMNTSFNLRGKPIVETPEDAISDFAAAGFDALYLQGWLIKKAGVK